MELELSPTAGLSCPHEPSRGAQVADTSAQTAVFASKWEQSPADGRAARSGLHF